MSFDRYHTRCVKSGGETDLWKVFVETPRGLEYWCWWRSEEEPSRAAIEETWRTKRHVFEPSRI